MSLGRFRTLMRRELQEHRMLWIGPLIGAAMVLVGLAMLKNIQTQGIAFNASVPLPARGYVWAAGFPLWVALSFISLIAGVLAAFYALDCLHAERKDRSILFWKSLPVSDAETVLSKFIVAVLVVPAGVLLLTLLMQPFMALVVYVRFEPLRQYFGSELLTTWLGLLPHFAATAVFAVLWFAPITAWLMLASVAAPRVPLAFAVAPALVAPLETLIFDTRHVARFLTSRLFPWPETLPALMAPYIQTGEPKIDWWRPFLNPELWAGLAVAVGMLYIIIRLRRYRDDT